MRLLDGKVCLITGGAGSIGLATARRFIDEGAKVAVADLRQEDLDRAAGILAASEHLMVICDVASAASVQAAIAAVKGRWGRLDVLVANAGNPGHIAPVTEYPDEAFDLTMAVHARGAFLACKHGLAALEDGGSIIITSSVAGLRGGGGINLAYAAAKHAQVGIVKAAARFAAKRGIRVNSVNPGPVDNAFQTGIEVDMGRLTGADVTTALNAQIPLGRHARPEEIAGTMLYLASDLSSYVTGTVNLVDGGLMS